MPHHSPSCRCLGRLIEGWESSEETEGRAEEEGAGAAGVEGLQDEDERTSKRTSKRRTLLSGLLKISVFV
ncbi:hypothetical protein EYF80_068193 [Liparis tanakae]|uniref:Uncharacterized protein n=1 Tax=Liparis tanakae TaxID=230148 RepID=A0A4Z2DYQ5_9TELE|nr:hypothetical protein EYF80_068193 [Liparis tanakae]